VVFEGDSLVFDATDAGLAKALLASARADPFGRSRGGDEPAASLAVPVAPPGDVDGLATAPPLRDAVFTSLLGLALLGRRLDPSGRAHGVVAGSLDGASQAFSGEAVGYRSPVLALLRGWEVTQLLVQRVRDVRRGYLPTEEQSSLVRGRILPRSLAVGALSQRPVVCCECDEFTEAVPLFRMVATALERLAAGSAAPGVLGETALARDVAARAARLRHSLASVPSLSVPEAIVAARNLRLSRLMWRWERVRELCLHILEDRPSSCGEPVTGPGASLSWTFDTATLWEDVLEVSLARSLGNRGAVTRSNRGTEGGIWCAAPWNGLGGARLPDLYVRRRDDDGAEERWVIDAKYKLGARPLDRNDQNQLLVYSLLSRDQGSAPTHLAVARPATGDDLGLRSTHRRADVGAARELHLHMVDVPFPRPEDAFGQETWESALSAMADTWSHVFSASPSTPPAPFAS
jgi:hypothetical protein